MPSPEKADCHMTNILSFRACRKALAQYRKHNKAIARSLFPTSSLPRFFPLSHFTHNDSPDISQTFTRVIPDHIFREHLKSNHYTKCLVERANLQAARPVLRHQRARARSRIAQRPGYRSVCSHRSCQLHLKCAPILPVAYHLGQRKHCDHT